MPGHAGHVVGAVAHQRLDVHHLFGRDAELLGHLRGGDPLVLHRIEHGDAVVHQLHEVLVGRDDDGLEALGRRLFRIGRDQVVGLVALKLDAGQVEGAGRLAHQGELRAQLLRRLVAVCLVFRVEVVAEGL